MFTKVNAAFVAAALSATAVALAGAPVQAQSSLAAQPAWSGKSKLGALMDNPATLAVLQRHVPEVLAEPDIGKGRGYSLKFLASYDKRLKAALPAIERDLAALPAQPAATR